MAFRRLEIENCNANTFVCMRFAVNGGVETSVKITHSLLYGYARGVDFERAESERLEPQRLTRETN